MSTLLARYAEYAHSEAQRALPAAALHHAKRAIIDWFSALYPGTQVAPATLLVRAHSAELGFGRSSLPGIGLRAFPATAAWINGSASHSVEFDDIFKDAAYHPGCPTIAAALAMAQDLDRSGLALLRAIVIGYEISTRIGVAVQPSHYRYFHTTGTVGCMGAAAAAAILQAPARAEVVQHALATATTFASGLQQAFRSDAMTKPLHAGHAASVGVLSAKAAAQGVTGVADMLEGAAGFGAGLSTGADWSQATEGLGVRYNIAHMTQKNHGCCGHAFAAIDAALALRDQQGIVPHDIARIDVEGYRATIDVTGNNAPVTATEAKFSLAYVVSHALLYGSVRLDAFSNERLADTGIRALMTRVSLTEDPQLTARFPSQRAARVFITLNNGNRYEHFAPCRKGDPEAPLSDADIDAKFKELVAPVIGVFACQRLLAQLWQLDSLKVADLQLERD
jgi:2-methylcitrate dehydratase PrpD